MKHVDEYRDGAVCRSLVERIERIATRRWTIMEVCGGQTHGLLAHGIDTALRDTVELLHGPGCPVCVTPELDIDWAIAWSERPDSVLFSFGDMLRVPGSERSLNDVRAQGAVVRTVYSPLDAVTWARHHPETHVVFFAVGFETTAPTTALSLLQADALGLDNFSLLVSHVRVVPAIEQILGADDRRVQGLLAAGHVCAITGCEDYPDLCRRHQVPVVVAGFEPVDLLSAILQCVEDLEAGRSGFTNGYARHVRTEGNRAAQQWIDRVYVPADVPWRGLGTIPRGGLRLRDEWARYDARERWPEVLRPRAAEKGAASHHALHTDAPLQIVTGPICPSGDVLIGKLRPSDCPWFGTRCLPESPLGAPMVSSEGACAAYFRHQLSLHR